MIASGGAPDYLCTLVKSCFTRRLAVLLLLLIAPFALRAQVFHIHCLSTAANGSVTVTWDRSNLSSADFRSYYVYHSTSASGPFSPIDSVFLYNDTTQTHVGANAAVNPAWYVIGYQSQSGAPEIYSDTVRAIQLTVLNPGSGFANLAWNVLHTPPLPTSSEDYVIYREYPRGIFAPIDTVDALTSPNPMTFSDLISICNDSINYRIEVQDFSGCRSISNLDGDLFRDLQPPSLPDLDSVSVDASGNAVLGWSVNSSPDTRAYVVLQGVGAIWTPIDTLFGINSTTVTTTVDASDASQAFELIAVDSCGNPSAQSQPHRTIFLEGGLLLCSRSVLLTWNAYSYWNNPVNYEVWRSANGSAEVMIGTTSDISYRDSSVVSGNNYCYRVIAHQIGASRTSTSSQTCVTPVFPAPPSFCSIRHVSVEDGTHIQVYGISDSTAVVEGYELLRATSPAGPFQSVARQLISGVRDIYFTDLVPSTSDRVYYYQLVAVDSCDNRVKSSAVSRSILLTGNADPGGANLLEWTSYGDWPTGVNSYRVFRTVNGLLDPVPVITVLASSVLELTDSVLDDFYSDGKFCYVVQAIEALGNPYQQVDTSYSNELCVLQQPTLFIPNAFHPGGGINEIFLPYPQFVSPQNYKFRIYNRWGQLIFFTDDPQVGWDGSVNGVMSEEAVYVYQIESLQPDGSTFQRVGSVTLIR